MKRFCLLAFILTVAPTAVQAAPQTFNTALPVATGEFIFREQFIYRQADGPAPADKNTQALGGISVLGYGVNSDLAVFGVLPWLDKSLDLNDGGTRITRSTRGIGDARVFGRYTVFKKNLPGKTLRIAPFGGIEMPTGGDDESDAFGRLPQTVQMGSGSWDPFGGVILTYQTLDYQIDVQAAYQENMKANDFGFGDEIRADASLQYRLWPQELGRGVPGFLYGIGEINFAHNEKNEAGGVSDPDSGGVKLFATPGLQYAAKRWIAEAAIQLPLAQNLNGDAPEDEFIIRTGFRINF